MGLRGRVRWQVLDERGVPEIPRNPSGFAIAPIEGVEQPNLITNAGLDEVALRKPGSYGTTISAVASSMRRTLAVGTGSTAPAATDTALVAEVEAAASSGAFDQGSWAHELDTDANVFREESIATRLVTMAADRNLTEYGFRYSDGDIAIRELFRDGLGDPVTISLLSGKIIKVDHTLTTEIAAPAAGTNASIDLEEYDATNTLVDTTAYSITHGPAAHNPLFLFTQVAPSAPTTMWRLNAATSYDRAVSIPNRASGSFTAAKGTYTPGSYELEHYLTFSAGTHTGDWYGFCYSYVDIGYAVLFTSPATYAKPSTHTLRLAMKFTWARA